MACFYVFILRMSCLFHGPFGLKEFRNQLGVSSSLSSLPSFSGVVAVVEMLGEFVGSVNRMRWVDLCFPLLVAGG